MVNVVENRKRKEWSNREKIGRAIWAMVYFLFRFSPRPLWGWRRVMLRVFGAKVGCHAHIYPTVKIQVPWHLEIGAYSAIGDGARIYSLGRIIIGERATISQGAHLCAGTHDISDPARPLLKLPIKIGSDAWVCADAFIGPGVTVGQGAIVGARAVAMKNVMANATVVGNPARPLERKKS